MNFFARLGVNQLAAFCQGAAERRESSQLLLGCDEVDYQKTKKKNQSQNAGNGGGVGKQVSPAHQEGGRGASRAGWMPAGGPGVSVWCDALEGNSSRPRAALLPASFQRSKVYCQQWMSCSGLALGAPQGLGSSLLPLVCPCHQSHTAWPNVTRPCMDVGKERRGGGGTGTTGRGRLVPALYGWRLSNGEPLKMTVEMFPGGSARCSWAALAPTDFSRWGGQDPAGHQRWLCVSAGGRDRSLR